MSKTPKSSPAAVPASVSAPLDPKERLRRALPVAVEWLRTRQASQIVAEDLEEFIALNWLEWHGGSLRLTVTGSNVCSQLRAAPARER